ncbi:Mu transposase C-terminal domain-containing protein [uncultured Marinobacter sp.]|uniref:Mu transposase C-terminal domain-containing protein n=1 Tax=uncultured Marinobacter sp. TaxID=187379 RepID=UPI0030DB07F2
MVLTWRARLRCEPEWYELQRWPFVDIQAMPAERRRQYLTNVRIVAAVLDGRTLKLVAADHNVSPTRVTQLMNRCLAGDEDAPPALTQGLIPHQRLGPAKRRTSLGTLTQPSGARCGFRYLLETVPGLEDHLMAQIRGATRRNRRSQNLTPRRFHASFIAFLTALDWPQDTYPFTSVSRGSEACRRFLKRSLMDLQMPRDHQRVIGSKMVPVRAFQEIHIDEAHIDCNGAAAVVLHNQMKPLRLGRISLLLARDVGTGCYLAATIALTAHPNSADVLALLEQLIQPWEPLILSAPGLSYKSEAGFPSALDETFCRPAFGIVRLDNALAHLSHQVRRMVCDHLSATANFGLPKNPKARALIEQAFRRLNLDIHRFPSTTGSYPTDPLREPAKLRKDPPFVSLRALEEAISVLLTEYNLSPLANLGAITPLEQMQYQMANHLLPLRAGVLGPGLGPYERSQTVTVRKGFKADEPRINFEGCQYTGVALNDGQLINQRVTIVFDIRDIRALQVTTLEGRSLGVVQAPHTWMRFAHSVSLRKKINHLVRESVLSARDPLGGWFQYTMAHRHLPKEALSLVKMARLMPDEKPQPLEENTSTPAMPDNSAALADALSRLPDWNPDMANKRR